MPHHEHDCEYCKYIGSFLVNLCDIVDAYLACDASSYDFIIRYREKGEYMTVSNTSPYYKACDALYTNMLELRD